MKRLSVVGLSHGLCSLIISIPRRLGLQVNMVICQHAKYTCSFCGKTKMKTTKMGIWHHGSGMKIVAGEAWTYNTTSAETMKSTIRRLKELKDQEKPIVLFNIGNLYLLFRKKLVSVRLWSRKMGQELCQNYFLNKPPYGNLDLNSTTIRSSKFIYY